MLLSCNKLCEIQNQCRKISVFAEFFVTLRREIVYLLIKILKNHVRNCISREKHRS